MSYNNEEDPLILFEGGEEAKEPKNEENKSDESDPFDGDPMFSCKKMKKDSKDEICCCCIPLSMGITLIDSFIFAYAAV